MSCGSNHRKFEYVETPVRVGEYEVFLVNEMFCPNCGWSAEHEAGWPKVTREFLLAGPLCMECREPLLSQIERRLERAEW